MSDKSLGRILLLNLILNTKELSSLVMVDPNERGADTIFASLLPRDLYSRLISNIDFDGLSEADKSKFLFLRRENENTVNKKELHDYEMQLFGIEAHNRTAKSLGIPTTNIVYCNFSENKKMNPAEWYICDPINGNIYLNMDKNYSIVRPSFFVENINAATRQHSINQNIIKAMKEPNSLSDREYFLVLSTVLKSYIYQELQENDPQAYKEQIAADYLTPSNIEQSIYSFVKTREDFRSAGLYGARLQRDLRRNEEMFHECLQEDLLTSSLVNMEDIIAYFKKSELNKSSAGMLGKLLDVLLNRTASSFYNSLGADMEKGQSISSYMDQLEKEMFDERGIDIPTDEELKEFIDSEIEAQEYTGEDEDNLPDDVEEDEDDDIHYRRMDSALPDEGSVDMIKDLPFSNGYMSTQGPV